MIWLKGRECYRALVNVALPPGYITAMKLVNLVHVNDAFYDYFDFVDYIL